MVIELEAGITVYPARRAGDRWRAVWYENGRRRQCEAVTEDKLAARLAKVAERLQADAPGLERPGADLIAWYLSPDRHPAARPWSRKHADTQRRLCERFIAPVIAAVLLPGHPGRRHAAHRQRRAHRGRGRAAAPVPVGHGHRGDRGRVPDQPPAEGRALADRRAARARPAGEPSPGKPTLFVDPAEIPADADVARLGRALAAGRRGDLHELMANTAAYTGLRQGELFALTAAQVDPAARVITVDRKVVEVAGKLYLEAPKGRKRRSTIYPARTPAGYPLAGKLAARAERRAPSRPPGPTRSG